MVTIYGGVAEICIMCAVIYIPVFQRPSAFQTADLGGIFWTPHFIYAVFIFSYNESVKFCVRNYPLGWVARYLAW